MRKVSEIPKATYGAWQEGKLYEFNLTAADIKRAIENKDLESRGYQATRTNLKPNGFTSPMETLMSIAAFTKIVMLAGLPIS